jgi:hypothetical protein
VRAVTENTETGPENRRTLLSADPAVDLDDVTPLAESTEVTCDAVEGAIWVADGSTSNVDTGSCYVAAEVTLRTNRLESATTGTGDDIENVDPVDAEDELSNIHRSMANCIAADVDIDTAGSQTGVWEANSRMCYPDGTTFTYIVREAADEIEEVEGSPIMVNVEDGMAGTVTTVTVGEDGEAATPPTVDVAEGTPSTPSTLKQTTTPAYDTTLNAVAVRFAAGSHSAAVGLVKTSDSRGDDRDSSITVANAGGPLSDGLSYHFQIRDTDDDNPWLVGLAKSLGGGSSVIFEHAKADDESSTALYLHVDF